MDVGPLQHSALVALQADAALGVHQQAGVRAAVGSVTGEAVAVDRRHVWYVQACGHVVVADTAELGSIGHQSEAGVPFLVAG